ncbi:hypothetical protein SO802_034486 [Lithocarpus litseifolius]|uniref:Aminotransferase-like plant mobile domain-containing protein n=1 Tax=Lithocarpus litseifolius TaxID=425828 RepID=A0AAW2BG34_9ROSI
MKDKGIVDKISTSVKKEIREKWMNLDEDSKLKYKKEARENSEKYANLSHNIPRKSCKVSLYTRCAPNRVRLMALNLNESQRFVIREMGFGSMLDLRSIQLDRDFCKWLVDHFDHNSCALDICGRRLPISTKDVEFILGIKSSGVDVSTVAGAEEINHICQQHGLNVVGDIPINLLEGKLKEMKTSGKEFVGCFLLFVLGTLLCPTPKPYIKRSFISILLNIDKLKNLNWAKLVLDFLIRGVRKYKEKNRVGVNGCLLFLMLFYFEHVNVETNLEHVSKRLQPRICYWGKKEVNQRMLKLHSIGSFDSRKGSDEAIRRIEQSITSLRDEMLVMQKTVIDIANNMDSFKNDILLELKKTAREHNGHSNDLNLNDIVDVKKEMKSASSYLIQDTIDHDDTLCAKKESKIESTSPVQDKMEQDDSKHIKKVSKIVSMEEDCNVHSTPLTLSNKKPGSKTPLSRNVDVDMLQLTFPHNVQLKASCVTPSSKPKVTRSQKRSPIVTSQAEVRKVKKRKEIKDSLQESSLGDDEYMNEFEPFTEMEKIICNYIFNKNFVKSEVLVSMKYEYGDRAAFSTLLPNQWISSQIINLFVCKMRMEENIYRDMFVWYLPTHFAQKMLEEDGNPTLEWFKKTYRDDDKHMSNLVKCERV